jgi:hypothetical protein
LQIDGIFESNTTGHRQQFCIKSGCLNIYEESCTYDSRRRLKKIRPSFAFICCKRQYHGKHFIHSSSPSCTKTAFSGRVVRW